jgi:RNA polymerase sigma-B factor
VHVPRDLQDRVLALDGAARELEALLGHQPTVASWRTPRPGGQHVLDTLHAAHARRADSLDVPYANDDAATLGDTIASHDDGFHRAEQREALARLTAMLPPRDRRILGLRFQHDLTQQIGELVGLSRCRSHGSCARRSPSSATTRPPSTLAAKPPRCRSRAGCSVGSARV